MNMDLKKVYNGQRNDNVDSEWESHQGRTQFRQWRCNLLRQVQQCVASPHRPHAQTADGDKEADREAAQQEKHRWLLLFIGE